MSLKKRSLKTGQVSVTMSYAKHLWHCTRTSPVKCILYFHKDVTIYSWRTIFD